MEVRQIDPRDSKRPGQVTIHPIHHAGEVVNHPISPTTGCSPFSIDSPAPNRIHNAEEARVHPETPFAKVPSGASSAPDHHHATEAGEPKISQAENNHPHSIRPVSSYACSVAPKSRASGNLLKRLIKAIWLRSMYAKGYVRHHQGTLVHWMKRGDGA